MCRLLYLEQLLKLTNNKNNDVKIFFTVSLITCYHKIVLLFISTIHFHFHFQDNTIIKSLEMTLVCIKLWPQEHIIYNKMDLEYLPICYWFVFFYPFLSYAFLCKWQHQECIFSASFFFFFFYLFIYNQQHYCYLET